MMMMSKHKKLIGGALLLSVTGILAKIISIFYKIPLTNLVKEEGLGYYQTVYPLYMLLTAAAFIGIPNTVSSMIAKAYGQGRYKLGQQYFKKALLLNIILGMGLSVGLIVGAKYFMTVFAWDAHTIYIIYGLSIAPMFAGIAGVIRGYFQGQGDVAPSAVTQLIESTVKVVVGITLVLILLKKSYPVYIAIGGAAIGVSVGFIASSLYMIYKYLKDRTNRLKRLNEDKHIDNEGTYSQVVRTLLLSVVPITIVSATHSIMNAIDSITLFRLLKKVSLSQVEIISIFGRLGKVFSVINVPLTVSIALSAVIIPSIALAHGKGSEKEVEEHINSGFRFASIFAMPSAVGIFVLANQIISLLYPSALGGAIYLRYYSICLVFMIMGQVLASVLQGLSKYYVPLIALGIAVGVKIVLNILLVNSVFMVAGALVASIAYYMVFDLLCYHYLRKSLKWDLSIKKQMFKPFVASVIMGVTVYMLNQGLGIFLPSYIATITCIIIGGMVYGIILIYIGYIRKDDLEELPLPQWVKDIPLG